MLDHPVRLIIIGFVLLVIGVIIPFLMVLQYIESTFFLNFASYLAQITGLFLGVIGAALLFKARRQE